MNDTICTRCHRRERAPGLVVCAACVTEIVGRVPAGAAPFVAPWRKRLPSRDQTGAIFTDRAA